jgi:hypothetical protein
MKASQGWSLALALVIAMAVFASLSSRVTAEAVTLETPFLVGGAGAADDCVDCKDGGLDWPYCSAGEHDAFDTHWDLETWKRNGGAHLSEPYCRNSECQYTHGYQFDGCPSNPDIGGESALTLASLEVMRRALLSEDRAVVRASLSAYPRNLVFNGHRSAIQVLDCKGGVVMHLPVPARLAGRLAPPEHQTP